MEEEDNIPDQEVVKNRAGQGDAEQKVPAALPPAPAAVPPPAQRRQVRQVAGLHGGEQVALADWLDPLVPGPHPGQYRTL